MRTAAIDEACGRFEATLSPRLGPALDLSDTRVTFDTKAWSVRCRADTPSGPLELRIAAPRREGDTLSWQLSGEPDRAARWRSELDERLAGAGSASVAAAVDVLRRDVAPREPAHSPLTGSIARATLGEDGALLAASVDAFGRYYGEPLVAVALAGDDAPSVGFPPVVRDQELLMYAPPPFRQDARTRAYLEDLGFAIDKRHRVFAVPTPRVFSRRGARLGVSGGLRPELRVLRATLFSPRAWLSAIIEGVFPINVHAVIANALARLGHRAPLHPSQHEKLNNHFHALGHDMGIHTLAMHRVGKGQMAELRRLARVARGRGRAGPAARFFEERLTRACVDTWAELEHPDEFSRAFGPTFQVLRAELARIAHA